MKEKGIVRSTENGICIVSVVRSGACGEDCANCSGACELKTRECTAVNTAGASAGDVVLIEMDSRKVLKSAFFVYILPLALFIACYFAADYLFDSSVFSVAAAFAAMIAAFLSIRRFDRTHADEYSIYVTNILKKA